MMHVDPVDPVTVDELASQVEVTVFAEWIDSLCARYFSTPTLAKFFGEKRGHAKLIQDELIPLKIWLAKATHIKPGALVQHFPLRDLPYDARIFNSSGRCIETIEITVAIDGHQDSIAGESTNKFGYAPLYSDINYTGHRKSRVIDPPDLISLDADEIVSEGIELITSAISRKADCEKYKEASLLVAFDDFRLLSVDHFNLVKRSFDKCPPPFKRMYLVGLSGCYYQELASDA